MVAKYIAAKEATIVGQAVADSHIVEREAVEEKVVAVAEVASFQANSGPVVPHQKYYSFTTITPVAIAETSYKYS